MGFAKRGGRAIFRFAGVKSASLKNMLAFLPVFLIIFVIALTVYLASVSALIRVGANASATILPNASWSTNGTVSFYCMVNLTDNWATCPGAGCNLTNITLWTNITGAWAPNISNSTSFGGNGTTINFTLSGIGSARRPQSFAWNCSLYNDTDDVTAPGFEEHTAGYSTFGVDKESPAFINVTSNNATHVNSFSSVLFKINVSDHNIEGTADGGSNLGNVTINYRRSGIQIYTSNTTNCHSVPAGNAGLYVTQNNCSLNVDVLSVLGLGAAQGLTLEYFFNASDAVNNTNQTPVMTVVLDVRNPWINATRVNMSGVGANLVSNPHAAGANPVVNASGKITVNITASDDGGGVKNVSIRWVNGTAGSAYGPSENMVRTPGSEHYVVDINTAAWNVTGYVNLSINVTDNATNSNNTFNITLFVDNNVPIISVKAPTANRSNVSSTFLLNVSVNDSLNINNVQVNSSGIRNVSWYWINSSGIGPINWMINITKGPTGGHYGEFNETIDGSLFDNGLLNITVNATDWAGNTMLQNFTIMVDKNAPNLTAVGIKYEGVVYSPSSVIVNITINTTGYFVINASANDSNSGLRNISWYWINSSGSGPSFQMTNGTDPFVTSVLLFDSSNYTIDASAFSNNNLLNITLNATDWAGNSRLVNFTVNITSDDSPPIFTSPSPAARSNISTTLRMFRVTVTERNLNMSRNVTLYYRVQTGGVTSWTRSKVLNCTGFAPNYDCNTTVNLANDLSIIHGDLVEYVFNGTDATPNLVGFNGTDSTPLNLTIDNRNAWYNATNSPTSGGNISGTITLNVTASDDFALSSVTYQWANASNGSSSVGPFTALSQTAGSMHFTASIDVSGYAEGQKVNLTVNVTDTAGNSNYSNSNITLTVDNTKPNMTVNSPLVTSNVTYTFVVNVTVNDSGSLIRNVSWMWINGSGYGPQNRLTNVSDQASTANTQGTFNATIDVTTFLDGLINITINATDWAGASNLTNITVRVDHTNASFAIVSPVSGANITGNFILNASVNDSVNGSGLRTVFWYWGNVTSRSGGLGMSNVSNHPSGNNGSIGYFNATVSGLDNGAVFLNINVTDWAGNTITNTTNVSVTIDAVAPNVTAVSTLGVLLNGTYTNNVTGVFIINVTVNDSFSLLKNVSWYWLNASGQGPVTRMTNVTALAATAVSSGIFNFTINSNEFAEGMVNITVNASDWAGNSQNTSLTVFVDNTAPNISILSPANSTTQIGSFVINVTVNDSITGVKNVTWYWENQSAGTTQTGPLNMFSLVAGGLVTLGTGGSFNATIVTNSFANSAVNITVNATDWAGNSRLVKLSITTNNANPILSNWSYNESSKVLALGFDKTIDLTRGVAASNISINFTDGSIADGVVNLAGANSSSTSNSSSVFITLTSGQDSAAKKIQRNDARGKVNITLYGSAVVDTGGNSNVANTSQYKSYMKAWHESPSWPGSISSRITIPQTSTLQSWGWNSTITDNWNISTVLRIGGMGANYNVVYYNTDGTDSGWKSFSRTDWVGSTLQYVNNTNDKDYEINMTGNSTRFELCCRKLT
ncbi:hypothetical protein HY640_02365 [Candidatus Woesearchaeota archaeon]|nr:hypothetical protein [Candidatus Woesearchaeota archaeon]